MSPASLRLWGEHPPYPDVFLNVLISTFAEFQKWIDSAALHASTRTTFWQKLFGTSPKRPSFNRAGSAQIGVFLVEFVDHMLGLMVEADL